MYENYLSSGYTHRPTAEDPRQGRGELVLYNPTPELCEATMTVYFADREPVTLPPTKVKPETNELVVMPGLAPQVFTDCGFWGAKVVSTTPLVLNLIGAVRVMPEQPVRRGGTMNFLGTKLHREWYYADGLWIDYHRFYKGDLSKASFPFNELEYYYFLNPNSRPVEIEMTLWYCRGGAREGQKEVLHFQLPAERVMVWNNYEKIPPCQAYTAEIRSNEPITTTAIRYIYGLHGLEEWGLQAHMPLWALPGPLPTS